MESEVPRKVKILRPGMWANVFDAVTGKKAIGSPVRIRRAGTASIGAIDNDDNARVFNLNNWRIEVL